MRLTSPPQVTTLSRDDFEQRMHEWRDSENAAALAEDRLRRAGHAASDPRMAQLGLEARDLRARADGLLAALVASLNDRRAASS
jgi:hypothetical protein